MVALPAWASNAEVLATFPSPTTPSAGGVIDPSAGATSGSELGMCGATTVLRLIGGVTSVA